MNLDSHLISKYLFIPFLVFTITGVLISCDKKSEFVTTPFQENEFENWYYNKYEVWKDSTFMEIDTAYVINGFCQIRINFQADANKIYNAFGQENVIGLALYKNGEFFRRTEADATTTVDLYVDCNEWLNYETGVELEYGLFTNPKPGYQIYTQW